MSNIEMTQEAAEAHFVALAEGDRANSAGVAVSLFAASFCTEDRLKNIYSDRGQSEATGTMWYDSGRAFRPLFEIDPEFWANDKNARLVRRRFTSSAKGKAFMSKKTGKPLSGKGLATAILNEVKKIDKAEPDFTEIVEMLKAGYGKDPNAESAWLQTCRRKAEKFAEEGDENLRDELLAALDIIGNAFGNHDAYNEAV